VEIQRWLLSIHTDPGKEIDSAQLWTRSLMAEEMKSISLNYTTIKSMREKNFVIPSKIARREETKLRKGL
jgi:hypothetical protein